MVRARRDRAALAPQVCAELLACAAKKSFLQEVAAATLCDALRQLPAAELHDGVCAPLAAQLARPLAEWSPATLLIALTLSAKLPPPAAARLLPHARLRAGRDRNETTLPSFQQLRDEGVLLVGSNFAPTDFLWCRFGVPSEHATRRGPWPSRRASRPRPAARSQLQSWRPRSRSSTAPRRRRSATRTTAF